MERVLPDPPRRPLATDRLWSVHDVAYYLDVPVQTIYSWRSAGPVLLAAVSGSDCVFVPQTFGTGWSP